MNGCMLNMVGAFATALSDRVADAIAGSSGLGQTAAEGLIAVCNHPGEAVEALAARLMLTPTGATRLLDGLERKHLVRRTVAAGDKRSRCVQPTTHGRRLAFEMFRARRSVIEHVLVPLSPAKQAELGNLLERLLAALSHDGTRAEHPCRVCEEQACDAGCCPAAQGGTSGTQQATACGR